MLSASSLLSHEDLRRFALGVSPQWDTQCDHLLHTAVAQLTGTEEPRGHVVLILDKVFPLELSFSGCICDGPLVEKCHLLSSAVPSEAAVGEHVHPEVSLCQPDAFSAFTYRSVRSKRGRTKVRPEEGCGCKTGVLCARPRCQLGELSGPL